MNHGQSNPGLIGRWATMLVFMINLTGLVTTVASADVETEAWRNIVRALDPAERTSRIRYVENLAKTHARGVAKVLVYLAENEPDPDIRGTAIFALMRLKDPTTEPALRNLRAKLGDPKPLVAQGDLPKSRIYQLEDPQDPSRIFIIAALYRITGEAGLREQLLALLRSRNLPQAMAAGAVLSFLREPAVLETLYQIIPGGDYLLACGIADHLLDEQNTPEVRRRLREAIKKRPVVGEPIQGQEIRETCIDAVLIRLARQEKR
jgi:HEAT repeat protein